MRLSEGYRKLIKTAVCEIFGETAQVFLFGSRIDDTKKGGDIDLFIELKEAINQPVAKTVTLNGRLQQQLGEQKIDIIVYAPPQTWLPIHQVAKETGILL